MIPSIELIGSDAKYDDVIPYLVEVTLQEPISSSFGRIKETLTRIGVAAVKDGNKLYQSCHILSKHGKYYILHFKTMFLLNGGKNDLTESDIRRQNLIINLLSEWKLVNIVDRRSIDGHIANKGSVTVIPHSQLHSWELIKKYNIVK